MNMATMIDTTGASYHCLTCASGKRNKNRTQHSRRVHEGEDVDYAICAGDDCRHCTNTSKFHEGSISAKITVFCIEFDHQNVPVEVRCD